MKVVLTLMVRDEADILAENLAFHLSLGVDEILVTDHGSTDDTPWILREFADAGHVRLFHEPRRPDDAVRYPELQSRFVTRMARLAATELGADWVINADADEFFWPVKGSLKDTFAAVPREFGVVEARALDFVLRLGVGPFYERMTVRETLSFKPGGNQIATKVMHRADPRVVVLTGNHGVLGSNLRPVLHWRPIEILHFPVRSPEHLARKRAWRDIWSKPGLLPRHLDGAVDDRGVAAGIQEGRLILDTRVADRLGQVLGDSPKNSTITTSRQADAGLGGRLAWPGERQAIAELRADMDRTQFVAGEHARLLERDLDTANRRLGKATARLEEIEASLTWRAGQRLQGVWRRAAGFGSQWRSRKRDHTKQY